MLELRQGPEHEIILRIIGVYCPMGLVLTTTNQGGVEWKRTRPLKQHKDSHIFGNMHEPAVWLRRGSRFPLRPRSRPNVTILNCSDQQTEQQ